MTSFKKAIEEVMRPRTNHYFPKVGDNKRPLYCISREEWNNLFVIMIPSVPANPMRMICTDTLIDVDYIPSVLDMIAKDWFVVAYNE